MVEILHLPRGCLLKGLDLKLVSLMHVYWQFDILQLHNLEIMILMLNGLLLEDPRLKFLHTRRQALAALEIAHVVRIP